MDGLSIAAGVAGLLSLGIQVTETLLKYYAAYKDQYTDVARMMEKLESLLCVFRFLDAVIPRRKFRTDERELVQEIEKTIQKCEEIIKELQQWCDMFCKASASSFNGRMQISQRRALYPLRKGTLQNLEDDIREIRENLSFALEALQLNDHKTIQYDVSELQSSVELLKASHISSTVRGWLMAPDSTRDHDISRENRHRGTGLWFIKGHQFTNWLRMANSFLWISGFAGCGKSVLCSTAIEQTLREKQHEQGAGIAFFYFDFSDPSKQSDSGVLRALLLQLSGQLKEGEKVLEKLYSSHCSGTPPVEVLIDHLRRLIERFHNTYILLDALDECPQYHRRRGGVLDMVETMRKWGFPGLHLLVTSRDDHDIRISLSLTHDQIVMMRNAEIDKDIACFVAYRLDKNFQMWKARHDKIQAALIERAQGVFRYVACQLEELGKARHLNHIDTCLRSLPRNLDETYERLLCSIDKMYIDDVRRILTVLCFSNRPLTVVELLHAHAVDLSEPPHLSEGRILSIDGLLDICGTLVEFTRIKDILGREIPIIRIAHFSVRQYLESDSIKQNRAAIFTMEPRIAHKEIAQICLVYLLDPALSDGDISEGMFVRYPFAQFAAMEWYHHYIQSQDEGFDVEKIALKLFEDRTGCFSTWKRLHNALNPEKRPMTLSRCPIDDTVSPLYYASFLGFVWISDALISKGFEVNAKGGEHGSALQAASYKGHEKVVEILLKQGADVNALGGKHGSALQAASCKGHEKVLDILLKQGADVNALGGKHGSALQAASYKGHEKVVETLLKQGADVNALGGKYGSALQAASCEGHEKVLDILLEQGADVNAVGGKYGSALQAASSRGHEKVVEMLLDRGADLNAQGVTALEIASLKGDEKMIQLLLDRGANVNAQGGSALQVASQFGHEKAVEILLNWGADVNIQGGRFGNALQAASLGCHEMVKQAQYEALKWLTRKAPYEVGERIQLILNPEIGSGNALHTACMELAMGGAQNAEQDFHETVVQILLNRLAGIGASDTRKFISLPGCENMVQMLLDRGADVNALGGEYGSALQAASYKGHEKVVEILLKQGADVNAPGGKFGSALQAASHEGHENVVQILLSRGANASIQGGGHRSHLRPHLDLRKSHGTRPWEFPWTHMDWRWD